MKTRLPGLLLFLGGLVYLLGVAQIATQPLAPVGLSRALLLPVLAIEVGVIVSTFGFITSTVSRRGGPWRRTDAALAAATVMSAFVPVFPVFPVYPFFLLFAATGVGIAASVRFLCAAGWPTPIVVASLVAFGLTWASNVADDRAWLLAPVGILVVLVGLWIVARPAPNPDPYNPASPPSL